MFYFLANVRPSTLESIQLSAIGKHENNVKYSIDEFMAPLVEDIKTLYCNGLTVSVGSRDHVFHGALLALADNLAAHLVRGFKQSMSFALRICRGCMITRELSQKYVLESDCIMRTPENHFEQCALLTVLHIILLCTESIHSAILEEVPGFSVTTGLPHAIMHDLFESVVPYQMRLVICHCVGEMFFKRECCAYNLVMRRGR